MEPDTGMAFDTKPAEHTKEGKSEPPRPGLNDLLDILNTILPHLAELTGGSEPPPPSSWETPPPVSKELPSLGPTWWVMDTEPGMDDIAEEKAKTWLEKIKEGVVDSALFSPKNMGKDLEIFPFQDRDGEDRLFLARYEFPKYDEDFQFSDAVFTDGAVAFIDFIGGFPIDCVEMLVAIGSISSIPDKVVTVYPGNDKPFAPPHKDLFKWPEEDKILLNLTALPTKDVAKFFAKNLSGEVKPEKAHWWFRVNIVVKADQKWPAPGEFLGLGILLFPGEPWGKQKSSPFIYSGNFFDSVYLSGGIIKEIQEPEDDRPYPTYTVAWHGKEDIKDVRSSDFAEYKVDEWVAILKDVATEKKSQLWKDDDMEIFDKEKFVIAPITYYGIGYEEE